MLEASLVLDQYQPCIDSHISCEPFCKVRCATLKRQNSQVRTANQLNRHCTSGGNQRSFPQPSIGYCLGRRHIRPLRKRLYNRPANYHRPEQTHSSLLESGVVGGQGQRIARDRAVRPHSTTVDLRHGRKEGHQRAPALLKIFTW